MVPDHRIGGDEVEGRIFSKQLRLGIKGASKQGAKLGSSKQGGAHGDKEGKARQGWGV